MTSPTASGRRATARAATTAQITAVARRHLAADGPELSLRAVARELGVVSSSVYRYFASRDELLTALAGEAEVALAEAVRAAETRVPRRDLGGRFAAVGHAVRGWAADHPHDYALLHRGPVPAADTVRPDSALAVFLGILCDGVQRGTLPDPSRPRTRLPVAVRTELAATLTAAGLADLPPALFARALTAWAGLLGLVHLERSGRFIANADALFTHQLRLIATDLGL